MTDPLSPLTTSFALLDRIEAQLTELKRRLDAIEERHRKLDEGLRQMAKERDNV
jgi:hypothetical protein